MNLFSRAFGTHHLEEEETEDLVLKTTESIRDLKSIKGELQEDIIAIDKQIKKMEELKELEDRARELRKDLKEEPIEIEKVSPSGVVSSPDVVLTSKDVTITGLPPTPMEQAFKAAYKNKK